MVAEKNVSRRRGSQERIPGSAHLVPKTTPGRTSRGSKLYVPIYPLPVIQLLLSLCLLGR